MNNLSAATVKRGLVDPLMDSQARNDEQVLLKINLHTPEPDSTVEHVNAILTLTDDPRIVHHCAEITTLVRRDLESNLAEREGERHATGVADQIARQLHTATITGTVVTASYRETANTLRPHLAVIASPRDHDGIAYFTACRTVDHVFRGMIPAQLFTTSLEGELGAGPYRLLRQLHAAYEATV